MDETQLQSAWDEITGDALGCLASSDAERLDEMVRASRDFGIRLATASPDQRRCFASSLCRRPGALEPLRKALEATWNNLVILRAVCGPGVDLIEYVDSRHHTSHLQEVPCGDN